jgi:glycerol-3-phosphate dehydrogenase subunit C
VLSECPLARDHIVQGMERLEGPMPTLEPVAHPIQVLARAYGL